MEEFTDTEATSHPVVYRTSVAGHHGCHDGSVQIVGAARRVQHPHKIRTLSHIGATVNIGLQTRVSHVVKFFFLINRIIFNLFFVTSLSNVRECN